ncbi:hypothetical protein [Falsiroseomonas sp. E2-1-a20]|uniref:hypothetical protein n=1 Tax=Falsiroseomonas sp. E2-1-a20 TaxID=3239300 RepID=UPI003F35B595
MVDPVAVRMPAIACMSLLPARARMVAMLVMCRRRRRRILLEAARGWVMLVPVVPRAVARLRRPR